MHNCPLIFTQDGWTPLRIAYFNKHARVVELLQETSSFSHGLQRGAGTSPLPPSLPQASTLPPPSPQAPGTPEDGFRSVSRALISPAQKDSFQDHMVIDSASAANASDAGDSAAGATSGSSAVMPVSLEKLLAEATKYVPTGDKQAPTITARPISSDIFLRSSVPYPDRAEPPLTPERVAFLLTQYAGSYENSVSYARECQERLRQERGW